MAKPSTPTSGASPPRMEDSPKATATPRAGNAVRPSKSRRRSAEAQKAAHAKPKVSSRQEQNVLRPSARRERSMPGSDTGIPRDTAEAPRPTRAGEPPTVAGKGASPATAAAAEGVPETVRDRFVQVGRKYYFPDGTRAFTDRGSRLTTASENTAVVASLVAIAKSREWHDITVSGTERFRREAYFEATLAGLTVRGYKPSAFEQARLVRKVARQAGDGQGGEGDEREPRVAEQPPSIPLAASRARRLSGTLVDHGVAPYRHDPHEPMSYFVKLETARGERTIWGVDLERAVKQSLTRPQIGDVVGLVAVGQEAVTVKTAQADGQGRRVERDLATHRNRWVLEKRGFFDARAQAAEAVRNPAVAPREALTSHPELAGTYLYLRGAEEIARRQIRDPEDQRRFVELVRGALADSVARGEPLAAMRLRERAPPAAQATRSTGSNGRGPGPARG